jgi:signal transduction histidine kinase
MSNKNDPSKPVSQEDFSALAGIVHAIAKGDFSAVDRLYELQGQGGRGPGIVDLAESIGMLLVSMGAGEFHMERATEVEERLKELNELKNEHLGIAAHDLRNPISAIRNMSQMLVEMELDETTKLDFLRSIYRVAIRCWRWSTICSMSPSLKAAS